MTTFTPTNYDQYQSDIYNVVKANPELQSGKEFLDKYGHLYGRSAKIKSTLDLYFSKLNEAASKLKKPADKPKEETETKTETKPKTTKTKKTTTKKTPGARQTIPPVKKRYGTFHQSLPIELTYFKRYLGYDKKKVKVSTLNTFLTKIVNDNAKGLYSVVTGKYGKEVNYIVDQLHAIKQKHKPNTTITFHLDENDRKMLNKFIVAVEQNHEDPSVKLMVRYNNLVKAPDRTKARRLRTAIENSFKNHKVRKEDIFYSDLQKAKGQITRYINGTGEMRMPAESLKGLNGFLNGKKKR